MPQPTSGSPRSKGRTGSAYLKARERCLRSSQICWLCNEAIDLTLKHPDPMSATVDHVVPVIELEWNDSRLWDVKNLKPAHLRCNVMRGNDMRRKRNKVANGLVPKVSRDWLA